MKIELKGKIYTWPQTQLEDRGLEEREGQKGYQRKGYEMREGWRGVGRPQKAGKEIEPATENNNRQPGSEGGG